MGKKRRIDAVDLDAERTLYSSFVSAANSMSQLYSQAVQQQRKSSAAASRQTLERVLGFVLKEYGNSDMVPKAAILQFLQQEYEAVDGSEHLPHQFPVQLLPTMTQGPGDAHHHHASLDAHACKPSVRSPLLSPNSKRANQSMSSPHFSAMDTAEHERHSGMEASMVQGVTPGHSHEAQNLHSSKFGGGFGAC